jgi:L-asparaginase
VGVIGGGDMTTEAAVCKFMYALGNSLSQDEVKKILARNISGELTM